MCNNYKSMIKKQFCMKYSMSNRITFLYLLKMLSTFQLLQNLVSYLHRQNFSWSYFYDHNCWQCCQNNPRSHRSTKTTKNTHIIRMHERHFQKFVNPPKCCCGVNEWLKCIKSFQFCVNTPQLESIVSLLSKVSSHEKLYFKHHWHSPNKNAVPNHTSTRIS